MTENVLYYLYVLLQKYLLCQLLLLLYVEASPSRAAELLPKRLAGITIIGSYRHGLASRSRLRGAKIYN